MSRNPHESDSARDIRHAQEAASERRYLEEQKNKEIDVLKKVIQDIKDENPDPRDWELLEDEQVGHFLVLKLRYPKCKSHKGIKVIVFQATLSQLVRQKMIDPHFGSVDSTKLVDQPKDMLYPIARFPGTDEGWQDAKTFAGMKEDCQRVSNKHQG